MFTEKHHYGNWEVSLRIVQYPLSTNSVTASLFSSIHYYHASLVDDESFSRKVVSAAETREQLMWILRLQIPHGVLNENK
jgi:hypothetical protein